MRLAVISETVILLLSLEVTKGIQVLAEPTNCKLVCDYEDTPSESRGFASAIEDYYGEQTPKLVGDVSKTGSFPDQMADNRQYEFGVGIVPVSSAFIVGGQSQSQSVQARGPAAVGDQGQFLKASDLTKRRKQQTPITRE